MRALLLAFTLAATVATQAGAAVPEQSDAEVRRDIQKDWTAEKGTLLLGQRIIFNDADAQNGSCWNDTLTVEQYKLMLYAQKAGYLKIRYGRRFDDIVRHDHLTVRDLVRIAAEGRIATLKLQPTPRANRWKIDVIKRDDFGCQTYKIADYKVGAVIRNERLEQAGRDFRDVEIIYRIKFRPMSRGIHTAGNIKISSHRKAHVLLQYDPEKRNWTVAAYDPTDPDAGYETTNVADYLARLK